MQTSSTYLVSSLTSISASSMPGSTESIRRRCEKRTVRWKAQRAAWRESLTRESQNGNATKQIRSIERRSEAWQASGRLGRAPRKKSFRRPRSWSMFPSLASGANWTSNLKQPSLESRNAKNNSLHLKLQSTKPECLCYNQCSVTISPS